MQPYTQGGGTPIGSVLQSVTAIKTCHKTKVKTVSGQWSRHKFIVNKLKNLTNSYVSVQNIVALIDYRF